MKQKLEIVSQFSTMKNDFENQNFVIFEEVLNNFGRSDNVKKIRFPLQECVVLCPTRKKNLEWYLNEYFWEKRSAYCDT
jgi:hypothetical protein